MDDARAALRREVLQLVVLVVALDALCVWASVAAGLGRARSVVRTGFTVLWTVATLCIVLRSLGRIRRLRLRIREEAG